MRATLCHILIPNKNTKSKSQHKPKERTISIDSTKLAKTFYYRISCVMEQLYSDFPLHTYMKTSL